MIYMILLKHVLDQKKNKHDTVFFVFTGPKNTREDTEANRKINTVIEQKQPFIIYHYTNFKTLTIDTKEQQCTYTTF